MESPVGDRSTELQRIVARFEDRLRLARASEMASWGRLLEAEALLCPAGRRPLAIDELDLLARIHVRQGRFDQAKRRWEDALNLSEGRTQFSECLQVLEDWLAYRKRLWIWRLAVAVAAQVLILTVWILIKFVF